MRFAVKRFCQELSQIFATQWRKYDLLQYGSGLTDRVAASASRDAWTDFVVPVCADQQQVFQIRPGQQIFEQFERCRIKPLQIVKEQCKRMFGPRENTDKAPKYQLKARLRVLARKVGTGGCSPMICFNSGPDRQSAPVRLNRFANGVAPLA